MRVDDFDFELPDSAIALRPAIPRDSARMLVVRAAGLRDRGVRDLPAMLKPGDVVVFNDTRVAPSRLKGVRHARVTGAANATIKVEVTLIKRDGPGAFRAFARPARRLAAGDRLTLGRNIRASVVDRDQDEVTIEFELQGSALDDALFDQAELPLPPYIASRRPIDARDAEDYQTIYATRTGAVAAPTAGLHFTERLLAAIEERGCFTARVTLHVGAGTFKAVRVEQVEDHHVHAEWGEITAGACAAINAARSNGGRVIAIGTTTLRLLESAASPDGALEPWKGDTNVFIKPGWRFRITDMLMTNFHLPRSTLFMLVCAFTGRERMLAAYEHAVANGYRFYSYGDATLLEREGGAPGP